jgi:hypothetical protein
MKIKSGSELDWRMALMAAQDIVKQCEDAQYTPPEAVTQHTMRVKRVCTALNSIVDALKLQHASADKPPRLEPK